MLHSVIHCGRHSLAVILPAEFVQTLGIKAGDKAKSVMDFTKGHIQYKFSGAMQLPLLSKKE